MGKLSCINIKNQEFISLVKELNQPSMIVEIKVSKWQEQTGLDRFPTKDEMISFNEVNFNLKAVDILSSDKAAQVFIKGKNNNWDLNKILTELQIPKEQKQIILGKNIDNREEIITALLAENSFTVEVNTAITTTNKNKFEQDKIYPEDIIDGVTYEIYSGAEGEIIFTSSNRTELLDFIKNKTIVADLIEILNPATQGIISSPSSLYSNVTVPGGTNYRENEIATPGIVPNIKGHAEFSTDNGIGWFRSDEKTKGERWDNLQVSLGFPNPNKTRRILEVQSDLFQKGRGKPYLTESSKQNQFLQLLNQKNNWVTFFVESIIQDSAKKGYEKVLFPKGDTAAKIEGHQTLEEFKKEKEARIKELESKIGQNFKLGEIYYHIRGGITYKEYQTNYDTMEKGRVEISFKEYESAKKEYLKDNKPVNENYYEINRLKQELADVESGKTKLSSVANFYETTITNILQKNGYNPVEINDEYGNKWNEVDLSQKIDTTVLLKDLLDDSIKDKIFTYNDKKQVVVKESKNNFANTMTKLFNNETEGVMAVDVLNNLINNFDDISQLSRPLFEKIVGVLGRTNAKVLFVNQSEMTKSTAPMEYSPSTKTIKIAKQFLLNTEPEFVARVFMHEAVHSITHHVVKRPATIDDKMFSSFMNKSYEYYKSKVSDSSRYNGFNNVDEFMADFFTDIEFSNLIKDIDSKSNKQSFLSKLISYLKMVFGISKKQDSPTYDKVMNSILDNSKTASFDNWEDVVFRKDLKEEPKYYKLTSIDKKLNYITDSIKDNLEENIRRYDSLIKKVKEPEAIKKYSDVLKNLLADIEKLGEVNDWKSVALFTNQLEKGIHDLKKRIEKEDFSDKNLVSTMNLYNKYLDSYDLINNISVFISDAKVALKLGQEDLPITKEELYKLDVLLSSSKGEYSTLRNDVHSYLKKSFIDKFNKPEYASEVLYKYRKKLEKEHRKLGITEPKGPWVNKKMNGSYKEEIDAAVLEYITDIVESTAFDISSATSLMNTSINTNSKLIQMLHNIIGHTRDAIIFANNNKSLALKKLSDKFIKEKGNKKPSVIYKNLIEYNKQDDSYYLKTEYSSKFKEAYETRRSSLMAELAITERTHGKGSLEYKKLIKNSDLLKWLSANTTTIDGKFKPIDKWKNDLSNLTEVERQTLSEFTNIINFTNNKTFGHNSLISKFKGATFIKLPSVTKSDLERVLEGNMKGTVKDKLDNIKNIRVDDVGYETNLVSMNNEPINNIKINFRGNLSSDQQSLDLFTIMMLEYKNGVNYYEKNKLEHDVDIIQAIAKNKKYYATTSGRIPILGVNINRNKRILKEGIDSNTYKKVKNMIESNVYDIMHKNAGKAAGYDVNKIIGLVNGWTGSVGMTLNEVTATANVLNGKAQLFLEAISGSHIKAKSLAKAEKVYFQNLPELMRDMNSPVKTSFINQITERFDTYGLISVSQKQAFIKNNLIKSNVDFKSLQFMQESGEHWMQSVLTMGVLDSIKVMNSDSNYINKDGKPVNNTKDAASLLDMISMKDGKLHISNKFTYTEHTTTVPYNEGGKILIDKFIKKKIFDTMGAYDSNMQPEAQRHAYGKLLLMYRKFLVPMGVARYRGFGTFDKRYENLKDEQLFFSDSLQEYEEGYYTTSARFIYNSLYQNIRQLKFNIIASDWNNLSNYQKGNIKKTVVEVVMTSAILPLLGVLTKSLADDDDELTYFVLLELRRLESELSAYRNMDEQWRILESPIPSTRILQNAGKLMSRLISPLNPFTENKINEKFVRGQNKGMLKIKKDLYRLSPILNSTNISYEEKYNYIIGKTN